MNKMTKGALATGLGVALLVGGGGTLAVWNTTAQAEAGTIKSGNLHLTATPGTWTNSHNKEMTLEELAKYKVVPGDKLTFTQPVAVTLEGELMKAKIAATDITGTTTNAKGEPVKESFLEVGETSLFKDSVPVTDPVLTPATAGDYTAKVTVTLPEKTENLDGAALSTALGAITFNLDQQYIDNK
jgi:alternate signal-mediated exported protein